MKDFKVTTHGERLGGAVERFNRNESLEDIAVGGRLAELPSAFSYIKNGQASLAKSNMTGFMHEEFRRYAQLFMITVERKWLKIQRKNLSEKEHNAEPIAL